MHRVRPDVDVVARGTKARQDAEMLLGIHHVSLNVNNLDEARDFYVGVLGGTERTDRPDLGFGGAWIDIGASQLHLLAGNSPPALGQHFAILVDDLDATCATLQARGVEVGEPSPIGTARQAFLTDPSGNTVELHQV